MALSGSFGNNYQRGYRYQVDWSATQNITNNTSTVTARVYLISTGSSFGIYSSSSKSGSITIDGTVTSFSAVPSLSGNQKKLIGTASKTITHTANGTKSFSISSSYNIAVTFDSYQASMSASASATLNTIPRASSISSNGNWTAGGTKAISINTASSSFTHTVRWYVNGTLIKTQTGVKGTTTTAQHTFTTAQNTSIFAQLAQSSSKSTRIEVDTFSGSTKISSTPASITGTCTAPSASSISAPTTFNIGSSFTVGISRSNSNFTHTIRIKNGSTVLKTYSSQTTSTGFATSDIATAIYNLIPNDTRKALTLECITYHGTAQVRSPVTRTITGNVVSSNPTFAGDFTYADVSSYATTTGNNQYIVQNKSSLTVTLAVANRALPVNGATMKSYVATLDGKSAKTVTWSGTANVTFAFGSINSSKNQTLSIKAIDSRGNSTTRSKTVLFVPYSNPVITTSAKRKDGFDKPTTITLKGSVSLVPVSSVNKNALNLTRYRYKATTTTTWGSWVNFARSISGANYTATSVVLQLHELQSYNIEIEVSDKFATSTYSSIISTGQPIFFIDAKKKSIGFNDFPSGDNEFRFNGRMIFGANQYASGAGQGEAGGGALFLNNSDITGVNGIFFNDVANNDGEGLQWLKSGKPNASNNKADYDNFRIADGTSLLNEVPVFTSDNEELWSGAIYMQAAQTVTPTKKLSECPNGWVLVWGRYNAGATAEENFNITYIPKAFARLHSGRGMNCPIMIHSEMVRKYIYISDTKIDGYATNSDAPSNQLVLRRVFSC